MLFFWTGPCASKDHDSCYGYPMDACENEWLIKNCKRKCGLCQGIPLISYNVFFAFMSPPLHLVLQYIHPH